MQDNHSRPVVNLHLILAEPAKVITKPTIDKTAIPTPIHIFFM